MPLRILEQGKKDPVLYIHGLGSDAAVWEPVAELCGPSLRVELYGHGTQSHFPPRLDIRTTAADLYTYLKGRKDGPLRVAGQGLGGLVALELAHAWPEMVRSLSLLDTPTWQTGWKIAQRLMLHTVREDFNRSAALYMEKLCPDPALAEKMTSRAQAVQPRAWYLYLRDMFARDWRDCLPGLNIPVQVLFTGTLAPHQRKLLRLLARFGYENVRRLVVVHLPRQGHFAMLEDPAGLAAQLEKFWAVSQL